ncbi:PAS domain S-box protein [Rubrobacter marinus]|uniref:PAS domain S-box protein n=1 Tax=Rubrobacter marinus TaxID=2653852 RepID=A0A6G8Q0S8_9ACTN|nr:PAS domain S-box protein [Rubrobacter marinus]QIN80084.1 PAS domain S-box protein [Rubrobacter marinus]
MRPQDLGIGKLFENVRDAVIVAEAGTGRIVLWNRAATEVFGYAPEEALGMSVEEVVPERLKERHRAGLSRYRDTGHGPYIDSYTVLDLPAVRKGGEEVSIELTLSPVEPLPESEAEGRFVLAVVRDVTERKRAEEALRTSEAELRALLAAMTDVILVLDAGGRYLRIAPTNPSLLYRPPEETIGHTLHELFPQDQADVFVRHIRAALETGQTVSLEYSLPIEEHEVWFDGTVSPMQDGTVLFVARDITERKRAEREIRELNAQLENRVAERTARLEAALAELKERERGLRESKERYQAVVEQAGEGIFLFDPSTKRILEANLAFQRMFGYAAEELGQTTLYDLAPQDPEGVDRNVARAMELGQIWVGERRYRRKDGTRIDVEVSGSVISYSGKEVVCSVVRDVTERKRAEEALRASEERFRSLVDQSPLSIQILSPDGRTLRVNRAWEELFGLTLEGIEGYNLLEDPQLVEKGVMPYVLRGFAGEPTEIPPIAYVPDETLPGASAYRDQERWVQAFIYPVRDAAGETHEIVLMHEDVSERKRAEEALRESEERYRAVVEQAAEGIVLVDVETKRIFETNAVYESLLGYSPDEMKALTLYDIVPYGRESMDCYVERVLERRVYVSGERRHLRKDGTLVDVEVSASVISYGGREAMCVVVRDITERKRAEEALREAREAERRRIARDMHDQVLSDLVYALSEIQIHQELYGQGEGDGGLNDAAEAMRRSVEGLRAAIFEMRLDETLERSVSSSLEALIEVNRRMARGRYGVQFVLEEGAAETIPLETGKGLVRVLQEALNNARRHSGASNIRVALRLEDGQVLAEVSDDGRGFDPRSSVGGVGMSSMRGRAEALGGQLEVESEPGKGTTVRFRGPLPS